MNARLVAVSMVVLLLAAARASAQCDPVDLAPRLEPLIESTSVRTFDLGDLDLDGIDELAVIDVDRVALVVYDGGEDGEFVEVAAIPDIGASPRMRIVDLIGDARPEIVLWQNGVTGYTLIENLGEAGFAVLEIPTLHRAFEWCVTDIDEDGTLDIVALSDLTRNIHVMRGDGAGGFIDSLAIRSSFGITALDVADVDGDAHADVVVSTISANTPGVFIAPGAGDGTFGALEGVIEPSVVLSVQAMDLNADGHLDLLLTTSGFSELQAWFGDGTGAFPTSTSVPIGFAAQGYHAADVNGDGHVDIIVHALWGRRHEILLGDGSGVFVSRGSVIVPGTSVIRVLHGGAGALARIVTSAPVSSGLQSYAVRADGTPDVAPITFIDYSDELRYFRLADVNGDGWRDLLVGAFDDIHELFILLGDGEQFTPFSTLELVDETWNIDVADITGDGIVDIVPIGSFPTAPVLIGVGDGTFEDGPLLPEMYPAGVSVLTDLSGDGTPDLVQGNRSGDVVTIALGNGDGSFTVSAALEVQSGVDRIAIRDVNDDDVPDVLLTRSGSSGFRVLAGAEKGAVQPLQHIDLLAETTAVDFRDVDGDGLLDAIAGERAADGLRVLKGNGKGELELIATIDGHASWEQYDDLRVIDVTGDGVLDVLALISSETTGGLTIFEGRRDGTWVPTEPYILTDSVQDLEFGDVNLDGSPDVFVMSGAVRCISTFLNPCNHCPPDLDRSHTVALPDLLLLLQAWGECGSTCDADLNRDGVVGIADLSVLLGAWGPCVFETN